MLMGCIDPGCPRVRSAGAGDAGASSSLRDAALGHPGSTREGRVFGALGRRLALLTMPPASPRSAIPVVQAGHMAPIRRPSEFIRQGAWRAAMPAHRNRRATPPGGSVGRPSGLVSRFLDASGTLDDARVVQVGHMAPIRRPSEFIRPGARRAAMPAHRKRRATPPGDLEGRPPGLVSRFLGASGTLDDASSIACASLPAEETGNEIVWAPYVRLGPLASPARAFLPRKRETRSYGCHMSDLDHLPKAPKTRCSP